MPTRQNAVTKTEQDIDARAHELYGLTHDEIKLVEVSQSFEPRIGIFCLRFVTSSPQATHAGATDGGRLHRVSRSSSV